MQIAARPLALPARRPAAPIAPAFTSMDAGEKVGYAVVRAATHLPGALGQLWAHRGEVLAGLVAPYLHPIRSLRAANEAVARAFAEDPIEGLIALVKHHGGLAAAWLMPAALILAPFTGVAAVAAAGASILGTAGLVALGLSLGKNLIDAATADSMADLDAQSDQILQDGMGLGMAGATWGASKAVEGLVTFIRGRFGPGRELPGAALEPAELSPAESRAARLKAMAGPSDAEIAGMELRPVAGSKPMRGNSVKLVVEDPKTGAKFVFKPVGAADATIETEAFAMRLRRAANEPTYAAVPQTVKLADGTELVGYVKPFIKNDGMLEAAPAAWTRTQREDILADHAWGEFLGNYDTKPDQSVVIGKSAQNLDWDRSLLDYQKPGMPLDRFKADNPAPPAANLLYKDFVTGKVDLDFAAMFDAVKRIQGLPEAEVRAALAPYLAKVPGSGEALVQAVLNRQQGLEASFQAFVAGLKQERAFNLGRTTVLPSWGSYLTTSWKDGFAQALAGLMDSPAFGWGNRAIQLINGWRTGKAV